MDNNSVNSCHWFPETILLDICCIDAVRNKAVLHLVFYKETPFQNKQGLEQVKNVNQQLWTDFSSFWYQTAAINHSHTIQPCLLTLTLEELMDRKMHLWTCANKSHVRAPVQKQNWLPLCKTKVVFHTSKQIPCKGVQKIISWVL